METGLFTIISNWEIVNQSEIISGILYGHSPLEHIFFSFAHITWLSSLKPVNPCSLDKVITQLAAKLIYSPNRNFTLIWYSLLFTQACFCLLDVEQQTQSSFSMKISVPSHSSQIYVQSLHLFSKSPQCGNYPHDMMSWCCLVHDGAKSISLGHSP